MNATVNNTTAATPEQIAAAAASIEATAAMNKVREEGVALGLAQAKAKAEADAKAEEEKAFYKREGFGRSAAYIGGAVVVGVAVGVGAKVVMDKRAAAKEAMLNSMSSAPQLGM